MRMRYRLENPDAMVATLTLTMTVGEWEQLDKELTHVWPASKLSEAIGKVLRSARKDIYSSEEKDGLA
jgi:hypothetical protein